MSKKTNLKPLPAVLDIGKFGFVICLLFVILILGFTRRCVGSERTLRFKFQLGDRYSLVLVAEQKMTRIMDGNEQTLEQTVRLECDFDIEEVDEAGFAWVKYTYRRTAIKVKSPELNFVFDSDVNQLKTPIQAMPLRMVVGEGLYLRITPQGRIEKINGLQALITSAKAKIGNFAGAGTVSQVISQRFVEPTIRRELEDQLRIFPESNEGGVTCPVRKDSNTELSNKSQISNGTWSRTDVLSSAEAGYAQTGQIEEVNIVFERTFRLNPPAAVLHPTASQSEAPQLASQEAEGQAKRGGVRQQDAGGPGGIAVVDVNLVIKPASAPVLSTPVSESPVRANREILGEGVGRIEIEEATGRIINSKMTQDTTERVKYVAQGPMLRPPPASEPITSHTVTTFQMTKREPPAPTKVEPDKSARPADANEKGA